MKNRIIHTANHETNLIPLQIIKRKWSLRVGKSVKACGHCNIHYKECLRLWKYQVTSICYIIEKDAGIQDTGPCLAGVLRQPSALAYCLATAYDLPLGQLVLSPKSMELQLWSRSELLHSVPLSPCKRRPSLPSPQPTLLWMYISHLSMGWQN